MAPRSKVIHLDDARRAVSARARAGEEGEEGEVALARGLREGEAWAERALVAEHADHVERLLTRMLGAHTDLDDLVQEVFVRVFARVEELREASALRAFVSAIAVFVAREAIRAKRRRRWLLFMQPEEMPELIVPSASPEERAALRAFYAIVEHLDADVRIAFTLRFVEGMGLSEIADTCGVSLATIKRRLKAGETEFLGRAKGNEALANCFEEGSRWHPNAT